MQRCDDSHHVIPACGMCVVYPVGEMGPENATSGTSTLGTFTRPPSVRSLANRGLVRAHTAGRDASPPTPVVAGGGGA
jgi:hypothetical protein